MELLKGLYAVSLLKFKFQAFCIATYKGIPLGLWLGHFLTCRNFHKTPPLVSCSVFPTAADIITNAQ